jgi:hypothetical protein
MPAAAPSPLDLDIIRASLGPSLVQRYRPAFGATPWLTAGTLTWPSGEAPGVLQMWRAWAGRLPSSAFTAVRRSDYVVAVDVAMVGEPWGAATRLEPLRALAPAGDTVGLASPSALLGRSGGPPARIVAAAAPKGSLPDMRALAAARVPEGVTVGVRHDPVGGPALVALGIAADAPRLPLALASLERDLRARAGID